jgi:transcriptional regulator
MYIKRNSRANKIPSTLKKVQYNTSTLKSSNKSMQNKSTNTLKIDVSALKTKVQVHCKIKYNNNTKRSTLTLKDKV